MAREFFLAEHGREPMDARELAGQIAKDSRPRTQTVAGYDLTFSPVKSVSTLWAVADPAVAAVIERAHQAAVQDALAFIEKHALFTRTGPKASGRSTSAAWSRPRSPTGTAGPATRICTPTLRWRTRSRPSTDGGCPSTDGCCSKPMLPRRRPTTPRSSSTSVRCWGCGSPNGPAPIRRSGRSGRSSVSTPDLNQRWSTRRAHIDTRRGELAIQFQNDHGRPPTPVEALHLAQQATLETRDAKHQPRSLAEQRTTWLNEAAAVLGGPEAVASMVRTALAPPAEAARIGSRVDSRPCLGRNGESRSTWQIWHVRAEAQRQVRTIDMPAEHAPALVDLLVDEVLDHRSIALVAPADNVAEPGGLRRRPCRSMLRNLDPQTRSRAQPP